MVHRQNSGKNTHTYKKLIKYIYKCINVLFISHMKLLFCSALFFFNELNMFAALLISNMEKNKYSTDTKLPRALFQFDNVKRILGNISLRLAGVTQ